MAWLKAGDTGAMNERVLNVAALSGADERSVNEVFGFVMRLYLQAAQQETDYVVSMGTAMVLSTRYELLLEQAQRTGLVSLDEVDGLRVVRLVQEEDFMHVRSREEIEWERQRKADIGKPELTVPVRLRDGDACRYCGTVVSFGMRRGNRAGTYDHRRPGKPAATEADLVVACRGCNSGRREAEGRRDDLFPLLPPPPEGQVYYSKSTLGWFEGFGQVFAQLGLRVPRRPKGARDRKPGSQTRTDVAPAVGATGRDNDAENAAPALSGDQRPVATSGPTADAAPSTGTDQRADTGADRDDATQRLEGGSGSPASATAHNSAGPRAAEPSQTPSEDLAAREVLPEVSQKRGSTSGNAPDRTVLEIQATGSGDPGSGRDGTGRAGTGRAGQERAEGPRPQGASGSPGGPTTKRKRGRRGRRRK